MSMVHGDCASSEAIDRSALNVCEPLGESESEQKQQAGAQLGSDESEEPTEATDRLHILEALMGKAEEKKESLRRINGDRREKAGKLMQQMAGLVSSYKRQVMGLIDAELQQQEETLCKRFGRAARLNEELKQSCLQAENGDSFPDCEWLTEESPEEPASLAHLCAALETKSAELRQGLATAQRALRSVLNPSDITLDPSTLHASLILTEDLRTVMTSSAKLPYPPHPDRFSSFFQVLSSQGFSTGKHSWKLETEGCQWVMGMSYRTLPRGGPTSGLESYTGSWCLMLCDGLLRAYSQGQGTSLMRTSSLRCLEIHLDYEGGILSFYSTNRDKVHLHTFSATFTGPLYLALRLMSYQSKSSITLCS